MVPEGRERRGRPRGDEDRAPEERSGLGNAFLREKPAHPPRADREVDEQKENSGHRRPRQEKEETGWIEDARLPVGEPGLACSGERIPERDLPGAKPVRRVQLQGVEEIPLVAEGRRETEGERRTEPEESGDNCRRREEPGHPSAQRHQEIVSGRDSILLMRSPRDLQCGLEWR